MYTMEGLHLHRNHTVSIIRPQIKTGQHRCYMGQLNTGVTPISWTQALHPSVEHRHYTCRLNTGFTLVNWTQALHLSAEHRHYIHQLNTGVTPVSWTQALHLPAEHRCYTRHLNTGVTPVLYVTVLYKNHRGLKVRHHQRWEPALTEEWAESSRTTGSTKIEDVLLNET